MYRTLSIWALSIGIVLSALAIPAEAARSRSRYKPLSGTFDGVITRLSRNQMNFETGNDNVKRYTVKYDLDTVVTGGGKQGTLDDLVVGHNIKITVKNDRAVKIEVSVK